MGAPASQFRPAVRSPKAGYDARRRGVVRFRSIDTLTRERPVAGPDFGWMRPSTHLARYVSRCRVEGTSRASVRSAVGTLDALLLSFAVIFVADVLAIGVGKFLGTRLPERVIRYGAAASFAVFGAPLILDAMR